MIDGCAIVSGRNHSRGRWSVSFHYQFLMRFFSSTSVTVGLVSFIVHVPVSPGSVYNAYFRSPLADFQLAVTTHYLSITLLYLNTKQDRARIQIVPVRMKKRDIKTTTEIWCVSLATTTAAAADVASQPQK